MLVIRTEHGTRKARSALTRELRGQIRGGLMVSSLLLLVAAILFFGGRAG